MSKDEYHGKKLTLDVIKDFESKKRTRRKIAAPAPATNKWENRIVGSGFVSPLELAANPLNYRKHPNAQREHLAAVLAKVGWVQEIVVNKNTGNIIDGHLRASLALMNDEAQVPVKYVDLSVEEEKTMLAAFDYISGQADIDTEILDSLLADLDTGDDYVNKLMYELASDYGVQYDYYTPEYQENNRLLEGDELELEEEIEVPDTVYPSSNIYGIPDLDLDMQATGLDLPCILWGRLSSRVFMTGTYHFYTYDKHFRTLWDDPSPLLRSKAKTIMELNYSITDEFPLAIAAYKVYQKRWISRWLQENGVKIIVDLCTCAKYNELNVCGVPKGWNAFSTRTYQSFDDPEADLLAEFNIAQEISGKSKPLFIVMQGSHKIASICAKHGWIHVPEQADRAKVQKVSNRVIENKAQKERRKER